MNGAPPPPPHPALACQRDPERWFDPRARVEALTGCLTCPARTWCAREALSCKASWGMWAGIWIDGTCGDTADYLRAIANSDAAQTHSRESITGAPTIAPAPPPPPEPRRPPPASPAHPVAAALLARSSGHCEVLADGCRYRFDRTVSRRPSTAQAQRCCPADIFAACTCCADMIAGLAPRWATRAGYLLAPGCDPASTPFHWRRSRWVLLGRDGWLTEIDDVAHTA
jgi:hypothetical protein